MGNTLPGMKPVKNFDRPAIALTWRSFSGLRSEFVLLFHFLGA